MLATVLLCAVDSSMLTLTAAYCRHCSNTGGNNIVGAVRCLGAARRRPGAPVGGAGVPVRQIRGVRQRDHNDDEPPDGRVEGESLQRRHHEGG